MMNRNILFSFLVVIAFSSQAFSMHMEFLNKRIAKQYGEIYVKAPILGHLILTGKDRSEVDSVFDQTHLLNVYEYRDNGKGNIVHFLAWAYRDNVIDVEALEYYLNKINEYHGNFLFSEKSEKGLAPLDYLSIGLKRDEYWSRVEGQLTSFDVSEELKAELFEKEKRRLLAGHYQILSFSPDINLITGNDEVGYFTALERVCGGKDNLFTIDDLNYDIFHNIMIENPSFKERPEAIERCLRLIYKNGKPIRSFTSRKILQKALLNSDYEFFSDYDGEPATDRSNYLHYMALEVLEIDEDKIENNFHLYIEDRTFLPSGFMSDQNVRNKLFWNVPYRDRKLISVKNFFKNKWTKTTNSYYDEGRKKHDSLARLAADKYDRLKVSSDDWSEQLDNYNRLFHILNKNRPGYSKKYSERWYYFNRRDWEKGFEKPSHVQVDQSEVDKPIKQSQAKVEKPKKIENSVNENCRVVYRSQFDETYNYACGQLQTNQHDSGYDYMFTYNHAKKSFTHEALTDRYKVRVSVTLDQNEEHIIYSHYSITKNKYLEDHFGALIQMQAEFRHDDRGVPMHSLGHVGADQINVSFMYDNRVDDISISNSRRYINEGQVFTKFLLSYPIKKPYPDFEELFPKAAFEELFDRY